ncbi:YlbG family protein [Carnobacteriaceae bacterium zg-ZUI252]|nr:YlbG family protein [Carnobacteriaceae bacterium zg-ZUI252]QTU83540.1 YlbG family protein [Carnobacteriaceae bacterium zg-C25]
MIQTKRKGLIVYVYSLKQANVLKKFGVIHYQSRKMNYVVLYVDDVKLDDVIQKINKLHFVRAVDVSHLDEIDMSFKDALVPLQKSIEEGVS